MTPATQSKSGDGPAVALERALGAAFFTASFELEEDDWPILRSIGWCFTMFSAGLLSVGDRITISTTDFQITVG